MRITKIDAILSLSPGAEVTLYGEEIKWVNPSVASVTEEQIATELAKLQADYEAKKYQRDRAAEYPPIGDQLDALWKGGEAAAEMLAKVQAVKNKYPKG